jgi:hypothetical protein
VSFVFFCSNSTAAFRVTGALTLLLAWPAHAQEQTTSVLDAAGSLATNGDVVIAGSLGSFGGLSSDAGPVSGRAGFPGQLYDPVSIIITPGSATLQENDGLPFVAEVICDDDTFLSPSSVAWSTDHQFISVSPAVEVSSTILPEEPRKLYRLKVTLR